MTELEMAAAMAAATEAPCSLCTEWFDKADLNKHGECFECVDHANATYATGA